ncbi:hypothetical protein F3W84_10095 [Ochrobactrum quorumnocens]|uniref:GGDEF domain-containing protein n=1 Tax=Ochrobactrum quorumnocens TaxID=271865 RepID=A0A5N1JVS6_9HYPH|nr:hypothetical protein F3W84_10095 [[Ochrobactrum] quorumnocens]
MGDAILVATAKRLMAVAGDGERVAWIGGDEFLFAHCDDQQSGLRQGVQLSRRWVTRS